MTARAASTYRAARRNAAKAEKRLVGWRLQYEPARKASEVKMTRRRDREGKLIPQARPGQGFVARMLTKFLRRPGARGV